MFGNKKYYLGSVKNFRFYELFFIRNYKHKKGLGFLFCFVQCKVLWWRCEIKEQKNNMRREKNVMEHPVKKITIVCFLSIMPYTHSDVIYFHSIVVDIFTKTLNFTESCIFETFNCSGFIAFWQLLSSVISTMFDLRVTTVNIT